MKKCKITNGSHCWLLEVDNETIHFTNRDSAGYFKKHYEELGYEVEFNSKISGPLGFEDYYE